MIYLFSVLRTLLFFMVMMIGSVILHQSLYPKESTPHLAEMLYAGIMVVTPTYLVFDMIATYITQSKKLTNFLWPVLIGLIVALFFAYSAARLA